MSEKIFGYYLLTYIQQRMQKVHVKMYSLIQSPLPDLACL